MPYKGKSDLAVLIGMPGPKQRAAPPKMDMIDRMEANPEMGSSPADPADISPDDVCFRTSDKVCSNCSRMHDDACSLLGISVGPGDSCNAFRGGSDMETPEEEALEEVPA